MQILCNEVAAEVSLLLIVYLRRMSGKNVGRLKGLRRIIVGLALISENSLVRLYYREQLNPLVGAKKVMTMTSQPRRKKLFYRFGFLFLILMLITPTILPPTPTFAQDDGNVVSARARVNQAMAHLSAYLELDTVISLERIEADDEDIPFVRYSWSPVNYTFASMGCPEAGVTYPEREVAAYRVFISTLGRTYDYRVSAEGNVVILCFGGRPHSSSIGLDLTASGAVGQVRARGAAGAGLEGGPARVDQAMRHVSDYIGLRRTVTLVAVLQNDPFIAYTEFEWAPTYFTNTALECPAAGQTPENRQTYGFNITLRVNGRAYNYRANYDGSILILCINGQAHRSSVGVG